MPLLLAIESSCDETSAAVLKDGKVLSNVVSSQVDHAKYGGVVPEIASRIHQQRIIMVVAEALEKANVSRTDLEGIAFTRGPGLLGSLLVGTCFAKSFAFGLGIPLVEVNHMQAHVLANFLLPNPPEFPFICLTVSGGHTQLVLVRDFLDMEVIGKTIDDAAGEAFDKAGKIMGLPYPAGPVIDRYAKEGNPEFHEFPIPSIPGLNYSFSGLKTSLLYYLQAELKKDEAFLEKHLKDVCASYQKRIVSYLLAKLKRAFREHPEVKHAAIAGGVSANSELRREFQATCEKIRVEAHIPEFQYCTDNAGMIAIAGYYKFLDGQFCELDAVPFTREA